MAGSQTRLEEAAQRALEATKSLDVPERADAIEHAMAEALARVPVKSTIYVSGDVDPTEVDGSFSEPGRFMLMDEDARLKKMPDKPTLMDFFKYRLRPTKQHLLQSANLARKNGCSEKVVMACLLHDISVNGFIRGDHGYWGAQLIEPYVDEEVSWAVRYHQALRFFPDEANGYAYPEAYIKFFGPNYKPSPLMYRDYEYAKGHKWYLSARQICVNDIYSFDPNVTVSLDDFVDIIGRNFRQPEEGLGYDNTPSSHMWRTIIAPTRFL